MTQRNALLSVFDKTGVVTFAGALIDLGWNIYSSGGTAKAIAAAGLPVTDVAELVGGGAILGHRVVTLSREVHAGLLARYDVEDDLTEMEALGLPYIDLVCFNLYPLAEEIAAPTATTESVIEKTDIGGPTALNSAAKGGRIVVGDPVDYSKVVDWLSADEPEREEFLRGLRAKAFFTTSRYYAPAAAYHSDGEYDSLFGVRVESLKYGENPSMQPAALYATDDTDPLALHLFTLVEGDARSLVGLTDVDCLLQVLTHLAAGFELNFGSVPLMAVGVKHGNACGAAVGNDPVQVIRDMVNGDKRAIFGGVVMTNFAITREVAEALLERDEDDPPRLFDGIFAPSFDEHAPEVLVRKHGKCRMMVNPALTTLSAASLNTTPRIRQVRGGYLKQPNYTFVLDLKRSEVYGEALLDSERRDIVTAWAIGCVSNSNTITLVHGGQLIGNGVGQQDRVGAAELAIKRAHDAGHATQGAVAWSDSFFPAPDGPEVLADAGITVIFASSGSRRDSDTIAQCEKFGVTLLLQPDKVVRGFAKH
jgi:phosphoribosylaminoimidazolecarboxamide formyltransferase/IMP cyclohydrolase